MWGYRIVIFAGDEIDLAVNLETVIIIMVVVMIGPLTGTRILCDEGMRMRFKPVFSGVGQTKSLKSSQGQRQQKHVQEGDLPRHC